MPVKPVQSEPIIGVPMPKSSIVRACVLFLAVAPPSAAQPPAQDAGAKAPASGADKSEKDKTEKDKADKDKKDATPRIATVLTVIADAAPRKAEVSEDVLA